MTAETFDLTVGGFRLTLPALESGPEQETMPGDIIAKPERNQWVIFKIVSGGLRLCDFHIDAHIIHRAPRLREVPFTLPTGQTAVLVGEDRDIGPKEGYFQVAAGEMELCAPAGIHLPKAEDGGDGEVCRVPEAGARIRVVD